MRTDLVDFEEEQEVHASEQMRDYPAEIDG